ncbi:META domain-containing protein [Hydrogenimonas sp.]
MVRKIFYGSWLAALLLMWQGCVSGSGGPAAPAGADADCQARLYGRTWVLAMHDATPVALKRPATLTFEPDGRIGGFDGCNSYFGKVAIDPTQMRFGPIGATRRFCRGEAGAVERAMLGVLKGEKWWQLDDKGRLAIFDDEHRLLFTSRP